jgi:hypothetical protein
VEVDGHVGLEEEEEHAARFQKFFSAVKWESRFTLCLSCEEFVKQADKYGIPFEPDFIEYLRGLSFKERRAFDMAMGYVFAKISDLNIQLPKSGYYAFIKAANVPLGAFYNEHRDRSALVSPSPAGPPGKSFCLDRGVAAIFDDGWYEPNVIPPVARWMSSRGRISFTAERLSEIHLDLTTHIPDLSEKALELEILLNDNKISHFSLLGYGWLTLNLEVPEDLVASDGEYRLELRSDRTWRPRLTDDETRDDRDLSIAVCNIEVGEW